VDQFHYPVTIGDQNSLAAGGKPDILTQLIFERFEAHGAHSSDVATRGYFVDGLPRRETRRSSCVIIHGGPRDASPTGKKRDLILPSFDTPRRNPKRPRRGDGINRPPLPPGDFVAGTVVFAVMSPAEGYREFVADLASHGAGLGEPQMVGVGGASAADQTRLRGNEAIATD